MLLPLSKCIHKSALRREFLKSANVRFAGANAGRLYLGIEIEESVQALLQLALDGLARTLQHMHCHVRLMAVEQLQRGIVNLCDLAFGQQP